jgi:D-arabinose 1-dehydrogenase-like Zn-dependent alcohol dehydrogenase
MVPLIMGHEVAGEVAEVRSQCAEYLKMPAVNLCQVPAKVPRERACILSDAVATSYHAMTKRA